MKRIVLTILISLYILSAEATHIVGGEIELLYRGKNPVTGKFRYSLSLIQYFDKKNGSLGARDTYVLVSIFSKRTHERMQNLNYRLTLDNETPVAYARPECSSGSAIETSRILYTYTSSGVPSFIELDPDLYSDPQGYYVAWERCCRNYQILNVYSQNPDVSPNYAGQTFYLEFPPLKKNGKEFINSSPNLFPPLADYACPGRKYYVQFGGTDADNDSLVYSLVTPLSHKSEKSLEPGNPPSPGPYPSVRWYDDPTDLLPSFGINNIMNGNPDLRIDNSGLLTVTPRHGTAGLYVFAVKCEEFRNGEKIGEVRRDFQMLVLAECSDANAPVIEAKPVSLDDSAYKKDFVSLAYANTVSDEERCVIVRISDPDSQNPNNHHRDSVWISAEAIDFEGNVRGIIPIDSTATLRYGSTATFTLCFPRCPYKLGPYQLRVITGDNSCPLSIQDTIILTIDVEPPPNNLPVFTTADVTQTVQEGSGFVTWKIIGTDADANSLTLQLLDPEKKAFSLEDYGFTFTTEDDEDGTIEGLLTWDTRCDVIDFSERINFPFQFALDDVDECQLYPPDLLLFDLTMDLVDVHAPIIEYMPDPSLDTITFTQKIYEPLNFTIRGTDVDGDHLVLKASANGFNFQNVGIIFPGGTATGEVQSVFSWPIDCADVDVGEYAMEFVVVDENNRCHYYLADTLMMLVDVQPPDNAQPTLTANGVDTELSLSFHVNEPISIDLLTTDADRAPSDLLVLELESIEAIESPEPLGYTFTTAQGHESVLEKFEWTPGCEIFQKKDYQNEYIFTFRVHDGRCLTEQDNTVKVHLTLEDGDRGDTDFKPMNIITSNGDSFNNYFAMVKRLPDGSLVNILPTDNCADQFISITIYNRWGGEVFKSNNRDFKWYAEDESSGVYYYTLHFTDRVYKGLITVASGG